MSEKRLGLIKRSEKEILYGQQLHEYRLAVQRQSQEYNLVIQKILGKRTNPKESP